jgi:hypothetical protein
VLKVIVRHPAGTAVSTVNVILISSVEELILKKKEILTSRAGMGNLKKTVLLRTNIEIPPQRNRPTSFNLAEVIILNKRQKTGDAHPAGVGSPYLHLCEGSPCATTKTRSLPDTKNPFR